MGVQVQFDYKGWVALFPEFAHVQQPQATMYFNLATTFHKNDGTGPVDDAGQQSSLLNLATAHFAQLLAPKSDGEPASEIVGRITDATQGSVSVSAEMSGDVKAQEAFWNQTKYGVMYWAGTLPFRLFRYRPHPKRCFDPIFR